MKQARRTGSVQIRRPRYQTYLHIAVLSHQVPLHQQQETDPTLTLKVLQSPVPQYVQSAILRFADCNFVSGHPVLVDEIIDLVFPCESALTLWKWPKGPEWRNISGLRVWIHIILMLVLASSIVWGRQDSTSALPKCKFDFL